MCQRNISLLLLALLPFTYAQDSLLQVQVVTRHGARTPLTKEASSLREGGSSLTPLGELQQYQLGEWLRSRYSSFGPEFRTYNASRVRIRSSAFERTMVSAQSLALGLFPESSRSSNTTGVSLLPKNVTRANIPVFTTDNKNDIEIRAYANCPAFSSTLTMLYASPSLKDLETQNLALLEKLALFPTFSQYSSANSNGVNSIRLGDLWNIFDAINVAKTECDPDPDAVVCKSLEDPSVRNYLTDAEWSQLQVLSHDVEHQKYGQSTAGNKLGSNLLKTIESKMSDPSPVTWVVYSAHYPTILGIFAAMGTYEENVAFERQIIPNYASAVVFELYETADKQRYIKLLYKEGLQDTLIDLTIGNGCESINCPLPTFTSIVRAFPSSSEWCDRCANMESDTCMSLLLANPATKNDTCDKEEYMLSVAVIFSLIGGICMTVLLMKICRWVQKERKQSSDTIQRTTVRKKAELLFFFNCW
ncbi:hypothetical protein AAMO2058_001662900 [Amorphochlora amoebiformis]